MFSPKISIFAVLALSGMLSGGFPSAGLGQASSSKAPDLPSGIKAEALKVVRFLDSILADSLRQKSNPLRKADFTESELNSFIAFRLEEEKEDILKELKLKMFAGNKIEGKAHVDLRRQRLPSMIKPEMTLYFEGILEVRSGQGRLNFKRLFLENQEVSLALLDVVIGIASQLGKSDAASIRTWVELPYGVKDLKTKPGLISIYY